MNRKQLIVAWLIVLLIISIIVGFGFQKYYIYSQGATTIVHKNYEEEGFYSLCLGSAYAFSRQPALRIVISILIFGGFLLYMLRNRITRKHLKRQTNKIALPEGLIVEAGKPHPEHPQLFVEKINKDGNVKIKGLRGFRDAKTPFLKGLTKKQRKQFQKELERLEKERKEYEQ